MMLFSFLKDIIYRKQGNLLDNIDNETEFQPWIIQRWLSMYSGQFNKILNNTTNKLYSVLDFKQDWYKLFLMVIPRSYFKKIQYIKKNKKDKEKNLNEEIIGFLAQNRELSKREVREYIDQYKIDISPYQKIFNNERSSNG